MTKSIKSRRSRNAGVNDSRPAKPIGYPLMLHASGRIARKVGGKLRYFGRWGNKKGDRIVPVDDLETALQSALEEHDRQMPYLSVGKTPPAVDTGDGCTLRTLCNAFWGAKRQQMLAGELSPRTFSQYEQGTDTIVEAFGKDRRVDDLRPDDFAMLRTQLAERYGVHGLKSSINVIRSVFKYALDNGLIEKPVLYGSSFNRPSAKLMRKARNAAGPRLFEAEELRTILDVADPVLRAMVLLGINCGFGNTDVASLPVSAVDLDNGWIDFPRPKTEIPRRVPLWPETVDALRTAIDSRPIPANRENADLCFLTRTGEKFVRVQPQQKNPEKTTPIDVLSQKFSKLLKRLNINGRQGLNFYTLRHNFQTIGGNSKDPDAVSSIMGHADASMSAVYRERINNERLQAVVQTVRGWLFDDDDE